MKTWLKELTSQENMGIDSELGLTYTKLFQRQEPVAPQLLSEEGAAELLQEWNNFHEKNHYDSFDMFYSKRLFCASEHVEELTEAAFTQVIADRCFLFLEQNERFRSPEYPGLGYIFYAPEFYSAEKLVSQYRIEFQCAQLEKYDHMANITPDMDAWKKAMNAVFSTPEAAPMDVETFSKCLLAAFSAQGIPCVSEQVIRNELPHIFPLSLAHGAEIKKADRVLEDGFLPTNAHKRLFNEMQKRSEALTAALHRRRGYMDDWQERPRKEESSVFAPFKVNVTCGCEYDALTKMEKALCGLFRAYLDSVYTRNVV